MSDKNPYEIRTELLHIAKDILTQRFGFAEHLAKTPEEKAEAITKYSFTSDDVVEEAKKLYEFVKLK